jgi:hypothetical protein
MVLAFMQRALPVATVPSIATIRQYKTSLRAGRIPHPPTRQPTWTEVGAAVRRAVATTTTTTQSESESETETESESESATESESESATESETSDVTTGVTTVTTDTESPSETDSESSSSSSEEETAGPVGDAGAGDAGAGGAGAGDAFWAGVMDARAMQCQGCIKVRAPRWLRGLDVLRALQWRYGGRLTVPQTGPACLRFNGARQGALLARLAPHRQGATDPATWARGYMAGGGVARGALGMLTVRLADRLTATAAPVLVAASCPDIVATASGKAAVAHPAVVAAWVPSVPTLSVPEANARADRIALAADNAHRRELGIRQMNARITPEARAAIVAARADPRTGTLSAGVTAALVSRRTGTRVTRGQVARVIAALEGRRRV